MWSYRVSYLPSIVKTLECRALLAGICSLYISVCSFFWWRVTFRYSERLATLWEWLMVSALITCRWRWWWNKGNAGIPSGCVLSKYFVNMSFSNYQIVKIILDGSRLQSHYVSSTFHHCSGINQVLTQWNVVIVRPKTKFMVHISREMQSNVAYHICDWGWGRCLCRSPYSFRRFACVRCSHEIIRSMQFANSLGIWVLCGPRNTWAAEFRAHILAFVELQNTRFAIIVSTMLTWSMFSTW